MAQKDSEPEAGQKETGQKETGQKEAGQKEADQTDAGQAKRERDFEGRLDEYANKISQAVSDGVKRVEEAFEKGKQNLRSEGGEGGLKGLKGSPRSGIVLIAIGIVWLLYIAGLFEHVIFPILLIIVGIYFVVRSR
jgi:hypothetical protein